MSNKRVRALCEGGITVAIATVLGFIKFFELPQGGSVCIGMLPIFIYCIRWGRKYSFIACFATGLLQLILDGAYAWGPTSMILDYILAYGVLGVCGFFKGKKGGLYIGSIIACLCRFVMHFISGITIYRIYTPTEIFNTTLTNPYLYSALYNGGYIFMDLIVCLIILALLSKPLDRFLKGEDIA